MPSRPQGASHFNFGPALSLHLESQEVHALERSHLLIWKTQSPRYAPNVAQESDTATGTTRTVQKKYIMGNACRNASILDIRRQMSLALVLQSESAADQLQCRAESTLRPLRPSSGARPSSSAV